MKKDLKLIFIIPFILLLIIGGCIYFKSFKINTENSRPSHDSVKGYGKYNSEEDLKKYIRNSFKQYSFCSNGEEFDFQNNKTITFYNLSDENIYHILYSYISNYGNIETVKTVDGLFMRISKKDFEDAIKLLFGKNILNNYKLKENFTLNNANFQLVNGYYQGEISSNQCTGHRYKMFYNYKSYLKENTYNVEYALYWVENNLSYDEENNMIISNLVYKNSLDSDYVCSERNISEKLDGFTKYRFVFVREDDNFIFDHIELIEKL